MTHMMRGQGQIQYQPGAVQQRLLRTGERRPKLAVALIIQSSLIDGPTIVRDPVWNETLRGKLKVTEH